MDKVMIVSSTKKGTEVIEENLKSCGYIHIDTASNGAVARRNLIDQEYEIIVINAPLSDEMGNELAINLCETGSAGVILIVKAEQVDSISQQVEEYGVFVLPKPFSRQIFYQGVKFVHASVCRIRNLNKEKTALLQKVEDIKIIDRAKCCLMEEFSISEQQAHRLLEKQAMDSRMGKRQIAEDVLNQYNRK